MPGQGHTIIACPTDKRDSLHEASGNETTVASLQVDAHQGLEAPHQIAASDLAVRASVDAGAVEIISQQETMREHLTCVALVTNLLSVDADDSPVTYGKWLA